jgi:signal transduction histidine kinase
MNILEKVMPNYVKFLRDNKQVIFSILLIIVIPCILVINTLLLVRSMADNMDYELRLRGEMAGQIVATHAESFLEDPELLNEQIGRIKSESLFGAISQIDVLVPTDEDYQVRASTDAAQVGQAKRQANYALAWSDGKSNAHLTETETDAGEQERIWKVVSVIRNEAGQKLGLVEIGVSTTHIDQKTEDILLRSLVILVISIIVVLLLIASNAQLFEYAVLFRKLKEVDHMKDDFISVASHELKTPVTAAKGFISLIQLEGESLSQDTLDDLDKAKASLERLGDLVDDLLDVSRIEQKRLKLDLQPVDVRDTLLEVIDTMRTPAEEKGLVLVFRQYQGDLPKVNLDRDKYRQILVNLISNAIKYTFKGKIEVFLEYEKLGKVAIHFQDTGIGMSAQEVNQLFNKFYRVRNRKARDVVGTGLGLWITKQLVEIMNGQIYVESVEELGSKFTIEFPIVE